MSQLSLFDSPAPATPRPIDLGIIRRHLMRTLSIAQQADILPWGEGETASWETRFPEYAALLPSPEGEELLAAFRAEIARLRAVKR